MDELIIIVLGGKSLSVTNEQCSRMVDNLKRVSNLSLVNVIFSAIPTTKVAAQLKTANSTSVEPKEPAVHEQSDLHIYS